MCLSLNNKGTFVEGGHVETEGMFHSALFRLLFFIKWKKLHDFRTPSILELKETPRTCLDQSHGHTSSFVWYLTRLSRSWGVSRTGFELWATCVCFACFSLSSQCLGSFPGWQWTSKHFLWSLPFGLNERKHVNPSLPVAHGFLPFPPLTFMTDEVLVKEVKCRGQCRTSS